MTKRLLLGLAMLVFGATLAFGGGRMILRAWESRSWPEVQGSVVSSSVETLRTRRSVSYRPHVRYGYSVGPVRYTSESIAFAALDTGDRVEANEYVKRFPTGASVTLHYSPEDPSIACIDCGKAGIPDYVVTVVGSALALFALSGLVDLLRGHLRSRRRQRDTAQVGKGARQATRG